MSAEVAVNKELLTTASLATQAGLTTAQANAASSAQSTIAASLNGTSLGSTPTITLNAMVPGPSWPGNKV